MSLGKRLSFVTSGLAAFGFALWAAASNLDEAKDAEELAVVVDDAHRVAQPEEIWSPQIRPAKEAERVEYFVDGEPHSGTVELDSLSPGYHFLETRLTRRGGRTERITDTALVGPFGERWADEPGCGVALSISERALKDALLPMVEEMALSKLRDNSFMGPSTRFEKLDFELRPNSLRFEVALQGKNRVTAEGRLLVRRRGPRHLEVRLLHLGHVSFTGETREDADMAGAALGAAVAGPVGAIAGLYLVDGYVDDKAREEIRKAIKQGLSQASQLPLIPERIELLPDRPASAVELAFCDELEIAPGGITGRLAVRPGASRIEQGWPVPGPVVAGATLPEDGPAEQGIRLDLTLDTVNALLDVWSANGLLDELIDESGMQARANVALEEWTLLHLEDIDLGGPPVLSMDGGTEDAWAIALANLRVDLSGVDLSNWGQVALAGRGVVRPVWDDEAGRLRLSGGVDDLSVTCVRETPEGSRLVSCLGPMLELGDFRERIDASLAPGSGQLPSLDVRQLVEQRSGGAFALGSLKVSRPNPGVLRFDGSLD